MNDTSTSILFCQHKHNHRCVPLKTNLGIFSSIFFITRIQRSRKLTDEKYESHHHTEQNSEKNIIEAFLTPYYADGLVVLLVDVVSIVFVVVQVLHRFYDDVISSIVGINRTVHVEMYTR